MSFGEGDLHEKVEKLETANGRLCEQVNELQRKVDKLTAEREHYRELFGKALDYAFDIQMLIDDEGLA